MKDHRFLVSQFCEQHKDSCLTCGFVSPDGKGCMLWDNDFLRQTIYELVGSAIVACEPNDRSKGLRRAHSIFKDFELEEELGKE